MKRYVKSAVMSISDEDPNTKYDLAGEPDPDILRTLSEDSDDWVVGRVALNPNTPRQLLTKLSNHHNWGVRYGIAQNTATPIRTLRKLSKDKQYQVRRAVALNPSTPREVVECIAYYDPDGDVRESAFYALGWSRIRGIP